VEKLAIAPCPNPGCATPIWSDHGDSWCHKCGEPFPEALRARLPRVAERPAVAKPSIPRDDDALLVAPPRVRALATRYRESYLLAETIVGAGTVVKVLSVILAVTIGALGLSAASEVGFGHGAAVISALTVGLGSWLGGLLLTAQGQLLLASLDQAVGTSPFLEDDQKAAIMALPWEPAPAV
jgi:hypothetical protein